MLSCDLGLLSCDLGLLSCDLDLLSCDLSLLSWDLGLLSCARARGLTRTYMRGISGVRAALFSNRLGERTQWQPKDFGQLFFWWGRCPSPHNLSYALPLGAVRCLTRCPLAQNFVLRVAAFSQTWLARVAARAAPARRCRVEQRFVFLVMCYLIIGLAVSGVSVLCFTWATVLRQCCREGASCGWRRSRKGVPTGSARIPRGTLRDVRAPAVWRNFRAHTCV